GLNMVMDKGLSFRQAEDLIDSAGHLTDLVKLGFGTSFATPKLKEKIALYQQADIKVYLGGTLFEAFIARGQFEDYRRLLDKLKCDAVEVSDGSIDLEHDVKLKYINTLARDLTVLSEVGSKETGILISPAKWVRMMNSELDAGSWKVIAEARESGTVGIYRPSGHAHTTLVNRIMAKVPGKDIIWEAPIKSQQTWFIKQVGANVNLGNVSPDEVIALEALRLGLRGDTFFEYLPGDIAENLRQIKTEKPAEKAKVKAAEPLKAKVKVK
ncbi:MAG: phosphosulfolactate synthase, partial [Flavobacteriales bacterium]